MKRNFDKLLVAALLMISVNANAQTYLITTVAGTGAGSFGPDGVAATASKLNAPQGVAADDSGNLYIADKINNRVRKVSKTGVITTIAGTGTPAYTGDNLAATAATLSGPTGVAKDHNGNIYIADYNNNVVRKVSPAGIITTVAGPGVATTLGDGGPATAAFLLNPVSVAVNKAGDLFIADEGNGRVRKVDPATGMISTYAGTTVAGFSADGIAATASELNIPSAICVDTFGNLFIADQANYRIRKVDVFTGMISSVVGNGIGGYSGNGGPAISAKISYTYGVAVDRAGNLFVSDNDEVRKVDASTGTISLYAGRYDTTAFGGDGGLADTSKLNNPQGLAVDTSGNLFIADEGNNRVRKVYKKSTVGVQQLATQNADIKILPNPNDGAFAIKGSLGILNDASVSLTVTNMLGQIVYRDNIPVNNGTIDAKVVLQEGVSNGYYLLNIRSEKQDEVARFVIQK